MMALFSFVLRMVVFIEHGIYRSTRKILSDLGSVKPLWRSQGYRHLYVYKYGQHVKGKWIRNAGFAGSGNQSEEEMK